MKEISRYNGTYCDLFGFHWEKDMEEQFKHALFWNKHIFKRKIKKLLINSLIEKGEDISELAWMTDEDVMSIVNSKYTRYLSDYPYPEADWDYDEENETLEISIKYDFSRTETVIREKITSQENRPKQEISETHKYDDGSKVEKVEIVVVEDND